MKIKSILSIAAFTAAFIFSTAFAGLFIDKSEIKSVIVVQPSYSNQRATSCWKSRTPDATAERITQLLEEDARNGFDRDEKLYGIDGYYAAPLNSASFTEYSAAISEYANESGSIEDDRLPQEFQIAWRAHMKAWRDQADFLEKTSNSSVRGKIGGEAFSTLDNKYCANITLTWHEVLRLAAKYGSDFRDND